MVVSLSKSVSGTVVARQPRMTLCSGIRGRERWHVKMLEDNPHLAAAVELVLQTEEGVVEARANPLTGRVLVRYDPCEFTQPVESLLIRALGAKPLSAEEFSLFRSKRSGTRSHVPLLEVEAGCFLVHAIFLGGFCPIGLACGAALFLVDRASHRHRRTRSTPLGHSESAVTN